MHHKSTIDLRTKTIDMYVNENKPKMPKVNPMTSIAFISKTIKPVSLAKILE